MHLDVLTLFPRMVAGPLEASILGKAQERGLMRVRAVDVRGFAEGKHHVTDDVPYGGGAGMVMKPEPLTAAIEASREHLLAETGAAPRVILMSPQGPRFDQAKAARLSAEKGIVLVCGRYEGIDERVLAAVDEELSVGDFVLTGGELAALCVLDAVVRLLPGVLGNELSATTESFTGEPLLEGPHYTRPPEFRGAKVPEILLSGDHAKIKRWRRQQSLLRTRTRRPDLFEKLTLSKDDLVLLASGPEAG